MKVIAKLVSLVIVLLISNVSTYAKESYPEGVSYVKVTAFDTTDEHLRLSDVLVGVFSQDGKVLGIYSTNSEGEVLIEVIPGIQELKVLQSTEGYELLDDSQVITIDTTEIKLYEVDLPHRSIETVNKNQESNPTLTSLVTMSGMGLVLASIGVCTVRYMCNEIK